MTWAHGHLDLDERDHNVVLFDKNGEGTPRAKLRDGVPGGWGKTEEAAALNLADNLENLAKEIRKRVADGQVKIWSVKP